MITNEFVDILVMNLTEEQQKAVETPKSLSVIASAGTGKTTVLTQRFLNCHFARHVPLYNILAFTFTEKASREMKERITRHPDIEVSLLPQLNVSTIHSFCHRVLKQHGSIFQLKPDFELFDEDGFQLWLKDRVNEFLRDNLDKKDRTFVRFLKYYGSAHLKRTVSSLIKQDLQFLEQEELQSLSSAYEDQKILSDFLQQIQKFQKKLLHQRIENQLITFDDLEWLTCELFQTQPQILTKYQKRFRHIMVDEYQDVSPRQFHLIKSLFNPEFNQVFIVGDPKQSIYAFRKADYRLFFKMTELIENHGGETIYLTQTFRTPEKLQSYFNHVFSKAFPENLFQNGITTKNDPQSQILCTTVPESKEKSEIRHQEYAKIIGEQIQSLIENGTSSSEIAILFFSRSAMDFYQKHLTQLELPVQAGQQLQIFDDPLILTAWHSLNYLGGRQDKITQVGILRHSPLGFSEGFIDHIIRSESPSLFTEQTMDLFSTQKDRESWSHLGQLMSRWKHLSHTLFANELFQTILNDLNPHYNPLKAKAMMQVIRSWQQQGLFYLHQVANLLFDLEAMNLSYLPLSSEKGVQLLTIHGSKGLEFEHVFLVPGSRSPVDLDIYLHQAGKGFHFKAHDCEKESSLKYQLELTEEYKQAKQNEADLDKAELLRLLYVALTRSKKSLYFYLEKPSQVLSKALNKNPNDVSVIKSYNEWLYWLTQIQGQSHLDDISKFTAYETPKESLPPELPQEHHPSVRAVKSVLTVTELETLFHCAKRFELKFLKGIRPIRKTLFFKDAPQQSQHPKNRLTPLERGNLYHEILQFYEPERDQNLDTVIEQALFNQHIPDSSGAVKTECHMFMQKLKQHSQISPLLFENKISYEEVEFQLDLETFQISGQIDKLVCSENVQSPKWMIIDYKTHHTHTPDQRDQLTQEFSFQMGCYALAMTERLGIDSIDVMILFTSGPDYRLLSFDQEKLRDFKAQLNHLFELYQQQLQDSAFPTTLHPERCHLCPYQRDDYCGVASKSA